MKTPIFSAIDIATLMAAPGSKPLIPTEEQQAIIEADPSGSVLVIAGAGSGKTETIANRVIWLVANGMMLPSQVLGLTFTRKAAGELAERMRGRLMTFIERAKHAPLSSEQARLIDELSDLVTSSLEMPEVSTYNAFAAALVQEFGSMSGVAHQLIDEAVAWGIARNVVVTSDHSQLSGMNVTVERLTEMTLNVAHSLSDHLSSPSEAREVIQEFARVGSLPYDQKELDQGRHSGRLYASLRDQLEDFEHTKVVIDLAEEYLATKREQGVLEFSDQIALARASLSQNSDAIPLIRERYRVVLLDEVQDTSVAQTVLLKEIFDGMHVIAVGDPHQSIYGWRGASSESLSAFHRAFASATEAKSVTLTLSTSWRNSRAVLEVANRASAPLRAQSAVTVPLLQPSPVAPEGSVDAVFTETLGEEAATVAGWVEQQRQEFARQHEGAFPTVAIILRKRKYMSLFADELRERGIPTRIIGVGGLLSTPEVRDLSSLLRCVWYPDASNDLIRILAGPRFAVGVADLAGLQAAGKWFASRDHTHQRIEADEYAKGVLETLSREVSLLDALDLMLQQPEDHRALSGLSTVGQSRLREAATMLRRLRTLISGDVVDLAREAIHELRIDIELESHERYNSTPSATARENLHAFLESIRSFQQISSDRSLKAVLEWLEYAHQEDDLAAYVPPPEPGTVQIITVHSAKGLEWDFVAVPRQVEKDFPSAPLSTRGEFTIGTIPDACRGDAASRPVCAWREASTQQEVREEIATYQSAQARVLYEEELRLIYVAYTRAKYSMLLSGSFWGNSQRVSEPSAPLLALRGELTGMYADAEDVSDPAEGIDNGTPLIPEFAATSLLNEKPEVSEPHTLLWPLDALGTRREQVTAAAHALATAPRPSNPDELTMLLLADAQVIARDESVGHYFDRVNASSFHDIIRNPEAARTQALRPMPKRPYRRTRIGNLFHDWVERRVSTPIAQGQTLDIEGIDDPTITSAERIELEQLIANFERSRWANLQPILVEQHMTIPFAGSRAVCKIDAVYEIDGRVEIVDWKTGRPPATQQEKEDRFLQLDLYRVAFALVTETPLELIDVTLFYVEHESELQSTQPRTLTELEQLWREAIDALQAV